MDLKQIRKASIRTAHQLGIQIIPTLPLLSESLGLRSVPEIASRILTLNVVVATAYGFDRNKAIEWLNREGLVDNLTGDESPFILRGANTNDGRFRVEVEGLWTLAWTVGIVDKFSFVELCGDSLVRVLPNLSAKETGQSLRDKVRLRPLEQIVAACDLAYCLHWAIRHSELVGTEPPKRIVPYVVIERRRALEWLLGDEEWDEVALDT